MNVLIRRDEAIDEQRNLESDSDSESESVELCGVWSGSYDPATARGCCGFATRTRWVAP